MAVIGDTLPDDPGTLKAMLLAERARAERLEQIIKELQRHRFGRRAETLPEDQLLLAPEDVEQAAASGEAGAEAGNAEQRNRRAAKRRANRGSLPKHLPRIEMVANVEDQTCPCCRSALHCIGEDVSERLDIVPAQFRVLVVRRPKYACRRCEEKVVQAPAPARLIEGGLPTEALQRIAGLYAVESDIRGRNADERRAVRQQRSRPIIDELEPWLRAKLDLISQKTKLAEAIRYALSRWQGLARFLDDGRIDIDSIGVERAIRTIALNRKNALFAGSDGGGEHWAVITADRNLQTQRHPPAEELPDRRHHQDRQRSSKRPDRRSSAVDLPRRARAQRRGLRHRLRLLQSFH